MNDNIKKHTQGNHHLAGAYRGFAKLLLEFNITFDDFYKTQKYYYVHETCKISKTVARTSLRSGIDRRAVSRIMKDENQYYRTSFVVTLLAQIEKIAKKNNMFVDKRGKNSIESIIVEHALGSTTLHSVIDELLALACIEDHGDTIKYLFNPFVPSSAIQELQQEKLLAFSEYIENYIQVFISRLDDTTKS